MWARFKTFLPSKSFKPQEFDKAIDRAMDDIGKRYIQDFQETVKTWEHKPAFVLEVSVTGSRASVIAYTDDDVYAMLDQGTPPHTIRARSGKVLAFPSLYTPKTAPRRIKAERGSEGGITVFATEVHHPGTTAREFGAAIAEKEGQWTIQRMARAFQEGARRSGHSL